MIAAIFIAIAIPAIILLIFWLLGYDTKEQCKKSEKCKDCPFPLCEEEKEVAAVAKRKDD